jgi:hypothetical protein
MTRAARPAARSLVVCAVAAATTFALGGVALAYRSGLVGGSGTGTATTSSGQITFTLSATSSALLYPGGPAGTVNVNLSNPFSQNVAVTGVTLTPSASGGTGSCPASSFTTNGTAIPASLAPGSATYAVSVSMTSAAANGCQGATVVLSVTITGKL